ncbi:MAG: MarR family winged helix-turn-helix transcriptional regulator [Pseudomonadota bacterium]
MDETASSDALLAAELIVHLSRVGQADEGEDALTPAQWTALRYFARANGMSRTPSAFADFHATTRGTASQTLKSLVAGGYLQSRRDARDGRVVYYEVTEAGRERLRRDPLRRLAGAIEALPAARREAVTAATRQLAAGLAGRRARGPFGTCSDCAHLAPCGQAEGEAWRCNCLGMALLGEELDRLCVDFEPRRRPRAAGRAR